MNIKNRPRITSALSLVTGVLLAACGDAASSPAGTGSGTDSGGVTATTTGGQGTVSTATAGTATSITASSTATGTTTSGATIGGVNGTGGMGGTGNTLGAGGSSSGTATASVTDGTTGIGGAGAGGATTSGNSATSTTGSPAGGYPEHTGAGCDVTAGSLAPNQNLPDPFLMNDGTRISTMAQWACRRAEIMKDIEEYEVGDKPDPPTVSASLNGSSLSIQVTTDAGSLTLSSNVGSGSDCVMISMGLGGLSSNCIGITFNHDQVVSYDGGSGSHDMGDPYYTVYPEQWGQIGKYSAWAWGVSRLIDGLEQVQGELGIDISRIGVQGCSYAGKMALFSGAFDERIALTIAQESGGGGINAWRTSQNFVDRTGTDIEKIDNTNGSWFLQSMRSLDAYSLPHDHHELIAMIAPRAVIALGNRDFEWLGDESGWKSMNAAMQVWQAMGMEDRIGYDFTTGHGHCQAPATQQASVAAFVTKFLNGGSSDTMIRIDPPANGFELDYQNVIDWDTPTLQ